MLEIVVVCRWIGSEFHAHMIDADTTNIFKIRLDAIWSDMNN